MLRWMLWQIEDLAVYLPGPVRRWWAWRQLGRLR
jgi:hypothetical protein